MNTFEFAIKMEIDGEKYYSEQAEKNAENPMGRVFAILAKAEQKHANLLSSRGQDMQTSADDVPVDAENVFATLAAFKTDVSTIPNQLDVYRFALELEQKSIDLYTEMHNQADNDQDRSLLQFLIGEEKKHADLFDQLVILVQRPEDWVEHAEFGRRPEY
jgi:rubrerythrin